MKLYLFLLMQDIEHGYDTYDSCVVVAETAEQAKNIHPDGTLYGAPDSGWSRGFFNSRTWAHRPEQVNAILIGEADPSLKANEVVIASFNAG
jgi:hypothetical protein